MTGRNSLAELHGIQEKNAAHHGQHFECFSKGILMIHTVSNSGNITDSSRCSFLKEITSNNSFCQEE